jgi:hypothetical protein
MPDSGSEADDPPTPRNPLSPYYPSETPDLPGNGRAWVALLLAAMFLLSAAYGLVALLV